MLLKCDTQYVSKFGKLSSSHKTATVFIPIPKEDNAENVQTTEQLPSFHMLARLWSKFFKLSFSNMWTNIFQMYEFGFEEAEEPEIKLPTSFGSLIKQGVPEKHLLLLHWL